MARYNADGSLDSSFGTNGKVITRFNPSSYYEYSHIFTLVLTGDNKTLVAGSALTEDESVLAFALARYNNDGSLDEDFGNGGNVTLAIGGYRAEARSLAMDSLGRILAASFSQDAYESKASLALLAGCPELSAPPAIATSTKMASLRLRISLPCATTCLCNCPTLLSQHRLAFE
ncbi:MAG: hypothetical protein KF752_01890 [Pirellulaceae bacterium]|nr:hypothetical protein [Pirellulaceae bacterium]